LNRHTSPQLDKIAAAVRADRSLKIAAQQLKHIFASNAETLLHGDLHTGSVMATADDTRVIDPEFAFYGPFAFDVGMLAANFWMSYFSQRGYETGNERNGMRAYLLRTVAEIWDCFQAEFSLLWRSERKGILYQASLFEDQGDALGAEQALDTVMQDIWIEALGFAGIEIHRRILGLAHNADFESIVNEDVRALCEARALMFGRCLAVERRSIGSMTEVNALAERLNGEQMP
jgi:5-methylthioribose kinase